MEKPLIAQKTPIGVVLDKGEQYSWCACGKSKKQPYCDGSHKGGTFNPLRFEATETGKKFLCACKQSSNKPYCDGTHSRL